MPMGARRLPWAKGFPSLSGATLGALWALYNKRKKASFFTFPVAYPASVLANSPASWARRGIARAVPPVLRPVGRLPAFWAEPPLPGLRPRGAKFVAGSLWGSASPPWPEVKGGQIYRSQLCRPSIAKLAVQRFGPSMRYLAGGPWGQVCRSQRLGPSIPSATGGQRVTNLPFATLWAEHPLSNWRPRESAVRSFLDRAPPPRLDAKGRQVCHSQPGLPFAAFWTGRASPPWLEAMGRKFAVRNFLGRAPPP